MRRCPTSLVLVMVVCAITIVSAMPAEALHVNEKGGKDDGLGILDVPVPSGFFAGAEARTVAREGRDPVPSTPWWERSSFDLDKDHISDALMQEAAKDPDSILDVLMSMDHEPDAVDAAAIERTGPDIMVMHIYTDLWLVEVWGADGRDFRDLLRVPGAVMLWGKGAPIAMSNIATPNMKARESAEYSPQTAWELGYQGRGVNIAVIDTGQDNAHPSLAGKWVGGADMSKPETPWWQQDGTFDADDTNGHGTTCAGIATGTGAPDGEYKGAAPEARLVDIRIGTIIGYAPGEGPLPKKWMDSTLLGQEWAIAHKDDQWAGVPEENWGIDIASESWGIDVGGSSDGSDPYSMNNNKMVEAGIFVFNAAGNDGPSNDGFSGMSASDLATIVAASDDKDTIDRTDDILADYSSRGPRKDDGDDNPYDELMPHITAPGTGITQVQFDRFGDGSGNGYGSRGSGTSYATPAVAGVAALMLEANGNLTPLVMRDVMEHTAERRDNATLPELDPFWNKDWGYGLIDAYRAVLLVEQLGEDVVNIDPDLQAYITNVTVSKGKLKLEGVAWSETSVVEKVELRIDNGTDWSMADDEANETWARWSASIDIGSVSKGNHTVTARAVRGDLHSTPDTVNFTSKGEAGGGLAAGNMTLVGVLLAVVAVLVVIYLVKKGVLKVGKKAQAAEAAKVEGIKAIEGEGAGESGAGGGGSGNGGP